MGVTLLKSFAMQGSVATLIFILLGQKGIQGLSNNTDEISLSKKAGSRGARNGGYCQTQADCRNPALDCVPSPSGGQWGTCMDLWDLRRECTSNADCMNGYTCNPHPPFYRPYCKATAPSSGSNDKNCCQDSQCPLDPTGTYRYCGTKPLDPTGIYSCNKCLDPTGVYGCLDPTGVYCVAPKTPPAARATREPHVYDDQRMQENCIPLKDECQQAANCPLDPTGIYQQCVKDVKTGVRFCKHPKTQCFTDRNCPQGQTCNTKYDNPQGSTCQKCLDPTGVYGCLAPTGQCVPPREGGQDCKPCKTKPLDPTGVYDGCLDPTGVYCVASQGCNPCQLKPLDPTGVYDGCLDPTGIYCVPINYSPSIKPLDPTGIYCNSCLDPTGVYGCLDPTGVYCVSSHGYSQQGCKSCKTKPLDPTGVYDGCLDPTGIYCVPKPSRTPPARFFQNGLDMLTPRAQHKELDPTGIYRVCEAFPPIRADPQYPHRMPPDRYTGPHVSCGNGMMDY